ncbi:sister chromatid cohesion protein DCC1-like isoform X2 [Gigantopelta aegis]|uniref:sister chromatid cohesion protein DCC1-like isoform X2 n=1 Tax=Gigantopelta aegis TaxID=1735272 RepID=UPI001B887C5C|nr:sister chromatid cohesion protein DCC1-like isoform X2 [Gigantopelta aegis]
MEESGQDENCKERTLDDVNAILDFAKLKTDDLRTRVQCIYFSEHLDNERIKLLEMDSVILDSLTAQQQVVIRGDKDENAVLCTNDKTFEIKEAETSNSMLIMTQLEYGDELTPGEPQEIQMREVCSVLYKYYELRPCKPKVKKLKKLLEQNEFSGKECEEDEEHQGSKFTYTDLLDLVQASETELQVALKKLNACVIDGYWRVLNFDFMSQVLNHIIGLCDENDWYDSGIQLDECCQALGEIYPRSVVHHVVSSFSKPRTSTTVEDDSSHQNTDSLFVLNEDSICRFFAEVVLRQSGMFNLEEFLKVWQQCVPECMKTSLHQIEGMALINTDTTPQVICYFPVENLPEDIPERFNYLFKRRQKWTLAEITPYIKDVATEKTNVGALLMKYARASLQNGVKVFNSKKPVT